MEESLEDCVQILQIIQKKKNLIHIYSIRTYSVLFSRIFSQKIEAKTSKKNKVITVGKTMFRDFLTMMLLFSEIYKKQNPSVAIPIL